MVGRFLLVLILVFVLGTPAARASELRRNETAETTLDRLSETSVLLSHYLQALSGYSPARKTVQQHRALMSRLASLQERARTILVQRPPNPRLLQMLETEFRNELSKLRYLRNRMDAMSERARNEGERLKGFFQGWQEKSNQVDQQLTSILKIIKDLGRIGVGGSDLGAS